MDDAETEEKFYYCPKTDDLEAVNYAMNMDAVLSITERNGQIVKIGYRAIEGTEREQEA